MPGRRFAAATASLAAVALADALLILSGAAADARPPSARNRYDRVTAGMTAAATEAALGGPGDAGPGDQSGGFVFERVDTFAVAESGTARRYWRLPNGLVVVERTPAGKIIGKMLLIPADVRPPA